VIRVLPSLMVRVLLLRVFNHRDGVFVILFLFFSFLLVVCTLHVLNIEFGRGCVYLVSLRY
jgi:hypothetical protein